MHGEEMDITQLDNTFGMWLCCGVIACSHCIIKQYGNGLACVCPWCGSLVTNADDLTRMIIPVEKPKSFVIAHEKLYTYKTQKRKWQKTQKTRNQ